MSTSLDENDNSTAPSTTTPPNSIPGSEPSSRTRFNEARKAVALHMAKATGRPVNEFQYLASGSNFESDSPSLVIPRLYLGDFSDASDEKTINRCRITHILSITELGNSHMPSRLGEREIQKLQINLVDRPGAEIHNHFERTTKWISDALEDETAVVLVCDYYYITIVPFITT